MSGSIELSAAQKAAVLGDGNFLLTACPGSGKTTSIAGRVADLSKQGQSVALLSYTKIGRDELSRSIEYQHGVELPSESYVGTIHSFVSRYLVRPFAHILTGSAIPVRVDQSAAIEYDPRGADSTKSHFDLANQLVGNYGKQLSYTELEKSLEGRTAAAQAGVVNYDDALYWALRVLKEVPGIAEALGRRFDEIIVDEAQDSNEVQLAILRELYEGGLSSLVLVGDFDQTIYAFAGSQPQLCRELADDCGLDQRRLVENYRASQLLCNATAQFRQLKTPDVAVGPYRQLDLSPKIVTYDPLEPTEVLGQFSSLIAGCGTPIQTSACLARGNALKGVLRGGGDIYLTDFAATILRVAEAAVPGLVDLREIEHVIVTRAFGKSARNLDLDELFVRNLALGVIENLPQRSGVAKDWFAKADALLDQTVSDLAPAVSTSKRKRPLGSEIDPAISMEQLSDIDSTGMRIDSIHKAKGESIDAVMVVAAAPTEDWHTPQAQGWASALSVGSAPNNEELRIFYVAITRARKLLALALPSTTQDWIFQAFEAAGFELA